MRRMKRFSCFDVISPVLTCFLLCCLFVVIIHFYFHASSLFLISFFLIFYIYVFITSFFCFSILFFLFSLQLISLTLLSSLYFLHMFSLHLFFPFFHPTLLSFLLLSSRLSFLVAVALRNQKVRITGGNGQVTEVSDSVSIPTLGQLTLCFEVERTDQKQVGNIGWTHPPPPHTFCDVCCLKAERTEPDQDVHLKYQTSVN